MCLADQEVEDQVNACLIVLLLETSEFAYLTLDQRSVTPLPTATLSPEGAQKVRDAASLS